jgi:hypothetical protein
MTGFKTGASSSGLNDEDDTGDDEFEDERGSKSRSRDAVTEPTESEESTSDATSPDSSGSLPWIYHRSSITDGRAKTVQLHLQQSTLDTERTAKSDLEATLGDTVNKADLREAAYIVGLSQLDAVAIQLREWGYDAQ